MMNKQLLFRILKSLKREDTDIANGIDWKELCRRFEDTKEEVLYNHVSYAAQKGYIRHSLVPLEEEIIKQLFGPVPEGKKYTYWRYYGRISGLTTEGRKYIRDVRKEMIYVPVLNGILTFCRRISPINKHIIFPIITGIVVGIVVVIVVGFLGI